MVQGSSDAVRHERRQRRWAVATASGASGCQQVIPWRREDVLLALPSQKDRRRSSLQRRLWCIRLLVIDPLRLAKSPGGMAFLVEALDEDVTPRARSTPVVARGRGIRIQGLRRLVRRIRSRIDFL